MLASVLRTPIAIDASIRVVRAFVRLREMVAAHRELARKLRALEQKLVEHDANVESVFNAIRSLMKSDSPPNRKPRIGFRATLE